MSPELLNQWLIAGVALFVAFHAVVLAVAGIAKLLTAKIPGAQVVVDACMKLSTDIGWVLDLLRGIKPPPASSILLLVVLSLPMLTGCGALLDQIPPGTTVCVEVTVVGVTVKECATNNETAEQLEKRALAKATRMARARGMIQ